MPQRIARHTTNATDRCPDPRQPAPPPRSSGPTRVLASEPAKPRTLPDSSSEPGTGGLLREKPQRVGHQRPVPGPRDLGTYDKENATASTTAKAERTILQLIESSGRPVAWQTRLEAAQAIGLILDAALRGNGTSQTQALECMRLLAQDPHQKVGASPASPCASILLWSAWSGVAVGVGEKGGRGRQTLCPARSISAHADLLLQRWSPVWLTAARSWYHERQVAQASIQGMRAWLAASPHDFAGRPARAVLGAVLLHASSGLNSAKVGQL